MSGKNKVDCRLKLSNEWDVYYRTNFLDTLVDMPAVSTEPQHDRITLRYLCMSNMVHGQFSANDHICGCSTEPLKVKKVNSLDLSCKDKFKCKHAFIFMENAKN